MNHSQPYIEECLRLIEEKWRRGPREDWSSYDFEKLNTAIFDATGVTLSISTLKRLFGKVSYPNLPSTHTLNTLARFAGFEDWNHFRQTPASSTTQPGSAPPAAIAPVTPSLQAITAHPATPPRSAAVPRTRRLSRWWPILLLPLAILLYSLLNKRNPAPPSPKSGDYRFTCDKVFSEGVPNSVVFHYHATVTPSDSVFICQTWDLSRRAVVPANGTDYSAIYYYPGYFVAKLIVDTQIVRTHNLMITSNGWLATTDAPEGPVPIYFRKEEIRRKEGIEIDSATLARYHLTLQPKPPQVRIFNMKDMGNLSDADFSFETALRTGFAEGSGVCQYVQVLIQCKDDIFIIPLAAKACIGNLDLYAAGTNITSNGADLSAFGCDLTRWTNLRVVSNHRHVDFFVNGKAAYSLSFPHDPTDIIGVQYRFAGTCAVKYARFSSGSRMINLN